MAMRHCTQLFASHRGAITSKQSMSTLHCTHWSWSHTGVLMLVQSVLATHSTHLFLLLHTGASTRAAINMYRAGQASALVDGRDYVVPDDIKRLTVPVLSHRVIAKGYLQGTQRQETELLIERLVNEVPTPA